MIHIGRSNRKTTMHQISLIETNSLEMSHCQFQNKIATITENREPMYQGQVPADWKKYNCFKFN